MKIPKEMIWPIVIVTLGVIALIIIAVVSHHPPKMDTIEFRETR
jgi:hypothetical protein